MKKLYDNTIIKHPKKILLLILLAVSFFAFNATKLEIDASAETLLLDTDKDLKFTREINSRYKTQEFLVVTYSPKSLLLDENSLETIKSLSKKFEKIEGVDAITSILTVPLLQSPVVELSKLVDGVKTIETYKDFDRNLVKNEFLTSPLYKNSLVSKDFKTTAILIYLKNDNKYYEFLNKRNELLALKRAGKLDNENKNRLVTIEKEFKVYRDYARIKQEDRINKIREIINNHKNQGNIFLGGVSMIATDIVDFVKSDLVVYGSTLILLLILVLVVIFRSTRWVLLPLFICLLSVICTTGVLGLFSWEVTVISSNFISLQLIITISIVLHLIVRYRELNVKYKNSSQYKLVINTVLSKLNPSFFAIITTIAGFASLILSNIQPVINLGWMMSVGIAISLILSFIVFPVVLLLLPKKNELLYKNKKASLIPFTKNIVEKRGVFIIVSTIVLIIFSLTGAKKLIVENSFINYFKEDTEIYKGMKVIDENLGGTTPLDVIIKFPDIEESALNEEEMEEDSFEDEFSEVENSEQYWFSDDKMNIIKKVHAYLESIPEVGKVQSLSTMLELGKILNKNKDLDSFRLALLYNEVPAKYKALILDPYINIEKNEARITMRIVDSNENLRRDELLKKINHDLKDIIADNRVEYRLSNLMVLYNNMLQSLFDSQISTLGSVLLVLFLMFFLLFRSVKIAFIAIIANIIPIGIIFGVMGWLGIPLDIMTITIAAISIGIGVDDTIHYIHRFKEEYKKDHDYLESMKRSHDSIGYAMLYTSLAVMLGFSILVLSNLIPTIYFGLLTVLVMATILGSALILLPKLILTIKPFKDR